LTGLRGTLLEQGSGKNFVVELDNLGYSLLMQLDPNLLRRVRPGSARSDDSSPQGFERYL